MTFKVPFLFGTLEKAHTQNVLDWALNQEILTCGAKHVSGGTWTDFLLNNMKETNWKL